MVSEATMSEQQQREQIEKRHQAAAEHRKEWGIDSRLGDEAHADRGQLLTWLRERDEQIASLRRELARFQRADVGDRVRKLEQVLIHDPPTTDAGRWRGGSTWHAALRAGQDAVDICRQQAARAQELEAAVESWKRDHVAQDLEIEKQAAEIERLREVQSKLEIWCAENNEARVRNGSRALTWKRCAKKWRQIAENHADAMRTIDADRIAINDEVVRLQERLRAYEGLRARIEGLPGSDAYGCAMVGTPVLLVRDTVMAALNEDAPTDKHERLDLVESCQQLEKSEQFELSGNPGELPASDEAYRPGLPPVALRKVCAEWEDADGDVRQFQSDGAFRWVFLNGQPQPGTYLYSTDCVTSHDRFRPHGKRWSEVEQEAARALGAEDAKAWQDRRGLWDIKEAVGAYDHDIQAAYHAAYDAERRW